jgi:hypothetical protein
MISLYRLTAEGSSSDRQADKSGCGTAARTKRTMSGIRGLVFRQLFEKVSSTYTYILGVAEHAIIIDPVFETGSSKSDSG